MRILSGIFMAIAFLGWFMVHWYHTKNLKQAANEGLPGLFFISVWVVIYYFMYQ